MPDQPRLIEEQTTEPAISAEEKAAYRERLRQKLQDPEFRAIEGFPLGTDEAILELSDPPYYTACPNPFLPEIIERWQEERRQIREELGLPDDDEYHREPFAADVSEGKNDSIYNAHAYHTKVPHKAIMHYILHYTEPGDIVLDAFSGTGMTGVAAQLCNDQNELVELGYTVQGDDTALSPKGECVYPGIRKTILNDLSPLATFVGANYNTPIDSEQFNRNAREILREVESECRWMYETWHPHCEAKNRVKGIIRHTVWSDVFICSECGADIVFWEAAIDKQRGKVIDPFPCPNCSAVQHKRDLKRSWISHFDESLGKTVRQARRVPVLINYAVGKNRYDKVPDREDLAIIEKVEAVSIPYWFPKNAIPKGDKTGDLLNVGISHVHNLYTKRNLYVLSALWERIRAHRDNHRLRFWFTSTLTWCGRENRLHLSNFFRGGGGVITSLRGTWYVASLSVETNVLYRFGLRKKSSIFEANLHSESTSITTQSATRLDAIPVNSVDYIFVDPPFGANLMYSELNYVWEAWLQVPTNSKPEAIVNKFQGKQLLDYQRLMERSFSEFHRVLKPGHWITVEFHNSKNSVWNAIQEALLRAGFIVADVRALAKGKGSFNQVTAMGAVKQDLIISAYKAPKGFEQQFLRKAGSEEGAWQFVRQHLAQLPVVVNQNGIIETLSERQDYLLFDRMVAFHIQRGATVPLSAAEFYAGLRERFVERDGMFFLPEQAPEYDRARLEAEAVGQLSLFVDDEKSAIQWLRQELSPEYGGGPQTYQEIQPKFLKQLHQARHEELPELSEMLEQNFLQDEQERWYVPDPNKASDLEKLRLKALLREFNEYAKGKKKLKQFRTEAVRAGFGQAWQDHDYETIVDVAERLPESVLQEDPELLMYYDNASLRV